MEKSTVKIKLRNSKNKSYHMAKKINKKYNKGSNKTNS